MIDVFLIQFSSYIYPAKIRHRPAGSRNDGHVLGQPRRSLLAERRACALGVAVYSLGRVTSAQFG